MKEEAEKREKEEAEEERKRKREKFVPKKGNYQQKYEHLIGKTKMQSELVIFSLFSIATFS